MRRVILFITSGFGVGYVPIASGTFGTGIGILYYLLWRNFSPLVYLLTILAFTALSCWLADRAEAYYGEKDSGKIVIDEIVGFLFTMFALPADRPLATTIVLAFFAFRFFDIVKPFPARRIDTRVKGGKGVVLDDVVAGIYANLALRLIFFLWA